MDDTQIVISLDDDRAKYIAEVISNKSCKKILDHLSRQEGAVSEVANDLKMPINTVDYNIKKLIKSGLIEKANYWWSVKGKKMPTYRVSNKKIVISPRRIASSSKYLFALLASGVVALGLKSMEIGKQSTETFIGYANETRNVLNAGIDKSFLAPVEDSVGTLSREAVDGTTNVIAKSGDVIISGYLGMDVWLWFLFGAWFVVFIFFILNLLTNAKLFKSSFKEIVEEKQRGNIKEYLIGSNLKVNKKVPMTKNIQRNFLKGGTKKNGKK